MGSYQHIGVYTGSPQGSKQSFIASISNKVLQYTSDLKDTLVLTTVPHTYLIDSTLPLALWATHRQHWCCRRRNKFRMFSARLPFVLFNTWQDRQAAKKTYERVKCEMGKTKSINNSETHSVAVLLYPGILMCLNCKSCAKTNKPSM